MKEKVKEFFKPQDNAAYLHYYSKRIKIFMVVSILFIIFFVARLFFILFGNVPQRVDDYMYICFFAYLVLFTGYNWWRFHQNSVVEEKKQEEIFDNPIMQDLKEKYGFPLFNHKKSRRRIGLLSLATVLFNVIMIAVKAKF